MPPMKEDHDFSVTAPGGAQINFDDRIGLPRSQRGADAWVTPRPMMVVAMDGRTKGREKLDTYIHEAMHILIPQLSETDVKTCAAFLSDVLWSAGYRRKCERTRKRVTRA